MIFAHKSGQWDLSENILIAGILNITPDSFSDAGKFFREKEAVNHASKMLDDGADMIDIGGESTRPGSEPVPAEEEIRRVIPVIKAISQSDDTRHAIISIDTSKYEVARAAIDAGAHIINDITAFSADERMFTLAAESKAGVILMHMKGTPKNMQANPTYSNLIMEIGDYLFERLNTALNKGINLNNIALDPGIGFGKTVEHNFLIIKEIKTLMKKLNRPILIGASRKSFIGIKLNLPVEERLAGSIAAAAAAAMNGAKILRVHDVKETKQAIEIIKRIL